MAMMCMHDARCSLLFTSPIDHNMILRKKKKSLPDYLVGGGDKNDNGQTENVLLTKEIRKPKNTVVCWFVAVVGSLSLFSAFTTSNTMLSSSSSQNSLRIQHHHHHHHPVQGNLQPDSSSSSSNMKITAISTNSNHTAMGLSIFDPHTDMCVRRLLTGECKLIRCNQKNIETNRDNILSRGFAIRYNSNTTKRSNLPMKTPGFAIAGSGCALSTKYGFLFLHNLKSGGTTIKSFLKNSVCPETSTTTEEVDGDRHPRKKIKKKQKFRCSAGDDELEIVDCAKGLSIARNNSYLIFSFARDPYKRFYSGYAMAEAMAMASRKPQKYKPFSFREFAFGGLRQRQQMSPTHASHYYPQANFLLDRNHCPVIEYVARLEYLEQDLLRIVYEIDRRYRSKHISNKVVKDDDDEPFMTPFLKNYYAKMEQNHGHIAAANGTSFGKKREEQIVNANQKGARGGIHDVYSDMNIAQRIAKEYEIDFQFFGYSVDHIPGRDHK